MRYDHIKNCQCSECVLGRGKLLEIRPNVPWYRQPEYDHLPAMRYNLHINLSKLQKLVWAGDFCRHQFVLAFIGTQETDKGPVKKYAWRRVRVDDARILTA